MRTRVEAVMVSPVHSDGRSAARRPERTWCDHLQPWTFRGRGAGLTLVVMGHPSVADARGRSAALRTVRHDGTPVYRYRRRPGLPPVSVTRLDSETAHAELPPGHRHAHDFLVLVYVEQGTGAFTVDGAERPLGAGEVHALSSGQVVGLTAVAGLARGRAGSVAVAPGGGPARA